MNLKELEIEFGNEKWLLNNQRSVYWPAQKALLISDLHLGKAAHFRKNGIAIPTQVAQTDLHILDELLQHYQPEKLIIVGDFVHAQSNAEMENFRQLKDHHSKTQFILIKGNHDRLSESNLHLFGIDEVVNQLEINQILLVHEPPTEQNQYSISGHLHPGIQFKLGKAKKSLPCFIIDQNRLILPAFSQFTGLDTRNHYSEEVAFYPFTEKEMWEMKW